MQIKKSSLEVLFLTLKGTEGILNLADARIRDTFLKPVIESYETFIKERTTIYETFCDKKEDGTPDIEDNRYKFSKEVQAQADAELKTLYDEEITLETPEKLKEFMEKSEYNPKVGEADIIDEIIGKL